MKADSFSDWEFDREITDSTGRCLRILQREVPLEAAAIVLECEPFFSLSSLLRYYMNGMLKTDCGRIESFESKPTGFELWFRSENPTRASTRVDFRQLERARITVWRVDDALDAIQLNIDDALGWLYLQTGGAALADLFIEPSSASILEASELFMSNTRATVLSQSPQFL